ncbi:unnamed protein product [Paramecium primaurelia]|uniref:Uncharacterized protein n=1 Tax=Paramecium primaurelia TaxID=5886 RepID=A0A8S1M4G5_PARPR|nr:unnamed protein product [Paramecium primaurelia]
MNNVCQEHGNQTITNICTFNHDCQKLMCPECQYSHQQIVPGMKILTISMFKDKLNSTINQCVSKNHSDNQNTIQKEMKIQFEEILKKINTLSDQAQNTFDYLFGEINQRDNFYQELFNKDPLDMSLKDLHKISNIWHNEILNKWKKQREIILLILQKKVGLMYEFLGKFIQKLENQISQFVEEISTTIDDDSPFQYESIIFPESFGIRHGQAFSKRQGTFEEYKYIRLNQNIDNLNQKGFILNKQKLKLTPFLINILEDDGQIQYLRDGEILKTEKIPNNNERYVINKNLEQVKHLRWEGSYDQQFKKFGKWNAFWKGKKLDIGGNYDEGGLKKGQWIELSDIYQNQCQVIETGFYQKGKKSGQWHILYNGLKIGGGIYDEQQELKVGNWKEIHQNFNNKCQIFYIGEYINGKKNGNWEIYLRDETSYQYQKIGCGLYDQLYAWKHGQWEELYNQYLELKAYDILIFLVLKNSLKEVFMKKEGKKVNGIFVFVIQSLEVECMDNQEKMENGLSLSPIRLPMRAIIKMEKELENGKKNQIMKQQEEDFIMKMDLRYNVGLNYMRNIAIIAKQFTLENMKMGKNREYGKQIIKVIKQEKDYIKTVRNVVNGQKFTRIFQSDYFLIILSTFMILLEGNYHKGKKTGEWITKVRQPPLEQLINTGGGYYDNGLKTGQWIELDQNYEKINQITYSGKYQDGKKVEIWEIKSKNIKIGGGKYLFSGEKDGEWIELDDNFRDLCQIVHKGVYQNGKKIGNWVIQFRDENNQIFANIGGGQYNDEGIQIDMWTELYQNFWRDCRIVFKGKYQNGKKEGKWNSCFQSDPNKDYELFAGGCYNQGLKNGPWIEFQEKSWNPQQNLIVSQYSNGIYQKQ